MAYLPIPQKNDGVLAEVTTSDEDAMELLIEILAELKITNKYFLILTETEITAEDIENDR